MAEQLSMSVSPDTMSINASLFAENTARILVEKFGYSESELTYCSGVMGVPITFLDKFNPEEFQIVGLDRYTLPKKFLVGGRVAINGKPTYARILICRKRK